MNQLNGGAAEFLMLDDDAMVRQCKVDTYRASGPGGQKRNKTSSAVRLRHGPTGLVAVAEEDRSQHVNKARAIRRLREVIARQIRRNIDLAGYRVSEELASHRTGNGRLRVSRRNREYAGIMAEVLDVFTAAGVRVSDTAALLGITTAQLVQFFERDTKLWERVNQLRTSAGLKTLT